MSDLHTKAINIRSINFYLTSRFWGCEQFSDISILSVTEGGNPRF